MVYVSDLLLVTGCVYGDASRYFDKIGRFSFNGLQDTPNWDRRTPVVTPYQLGKSAIASLT